MSVTLPAGWRNDPKLAETMLSLLRQAREVKLPPLSYPAPGDLAAVLDPHTVQTSALDLIDRELVRAYDTPNARLIISMPPQEGKSQRATKTGALWALIRNPEHRIGVVSYSSELATSFGREIRGWIQNNQGQDGTLDLRLRLAKDNNAAARWRLEGHRGGLITAGVGSGLTGQALDALIIDDPFADREQAASPTYRQKVWDWWTDVGATRLAPGAPVILIMTRWHEDDLAGRMLAAEDGNQWRVINVPAQADHRPELGQTDPLGREPGEWLTSARGRTVEEWEAIRVRSGTRTFTALYQGHPTPDAGDILVRQWWRRYDTPLWSTSDGGQTYRIVGDHDEMFTSWDMAFKDTKSSDFVVGQVWLRRDADVFLLDQVRARLSFTASVAAVQAIVRKWPQVRTHIVEDKANGTAVLSTLRSKVPGMVAVNPTDSKLGRASAVAPFLEAGNVHLPSDEIALFVGPDNSPETLIGEASAFPNAAHDDQVDALTQALHRFFIAGAGASSWIESIRKQTAGVTPTVQPPATASAPEPDLDASAPEKPTIDPHIAARAEQLRAMFR